MQFALVIPWPHLMLCTQDANWLVVSDQEGSVRLYRAEYSENLQVLGFLTLQRWDVN